MQTREMFRADLQALSSKVHAVASQDLAIRSRYFKVRAALPIMCFLISPLIPTDTC